MKRSGNFRTNLSLGWFFSVVSQNSMFKLNSASLSAQSKLPKKMFNFTIKYINNILPTLFNLHKCVCCKHQIVPSVFIHKSFLHVIAGYQTYLTLARFTWQHNSINDTILPFIANTFLSTRFFYKKVVLNCSKVKKVQY